MTDTEFFNQELIKNYLLFSIYDVDEFVLREVDKIKSSNAIDIWDVGKAKRYSYEVFRVSENKCEEEEISTKDYLDKEEQGYSLCFTRLNYEDFEDEFPLDELLQRYDDDWLLNFHYNKAFLPSAIEWVQETEGDGGKKLKIRKILQTLKGSKNSLENITYSSHKNEPLNEIQKTVIEIFIRFNEVMLDGVTSYFKDIFPELFDKKEASLNEKVIKTTSNDALSHYLFIGLKEQKIFEEYELKLIDNEFLSKDKNEWLKNPSSFIRFYNYCEAKNLFKKEFKKSKDGVSLLRRLYNFHISNNIDAPDKRQLQENKKNKHQYYFLKNTINSTYKFS
ncbi:hypothetical protein CW731_03175 [Polaribacter sp. ALD11]|uniref:hypothetical protein n=1 Tax=Polaribacter sp. ALD11 TaxID=2058137 RepID=UPI000C3173B4|nr:hypothetical protein [Polaribacter sp. ALD11]AUC84358.1 hypothetical protein CW731_03175 [Polaribacter sp. ALD11]